MRILIAEDDPVPRCVLERTLREWGHEVVTACDGLAAWEVLQDEAPPRLAILDWMMPGLDGPEVCRRARGLARREPTYCILLTARNGKADVAAGLEGGADDYVTKPFDRQELRARVRVGERMVELQHGLANRVRELETALAQVKQLRGLLPICCYCKKIRDDGNYWQQVEAYISAHTEARFSHGICPACWHDVVEPQMAKAGIHRATVVAAEDRAAGLTRQLFSAKSPLGQVGMPHDRETVLLVEDEDGVRALTRHVLQDCGYTVLEARDGTEALRIAGQHQGRIDLLVTDVVMPRLNGRQVAERLAGMRAGLKVLFLSGYTDDVVRHGILEAEAAFLQKPFSPASLAAKVREVLDSGSGGHFLAAVSAQP